MSNILNFNNQNTTILLEIYRGKLYNEILNKFINVCLKNFNEKIFSNKKKYYRTLVNLLSSWIFTQYSYYDFKNDSFFPDINNNDLLKQTLYNYSSLDNIDDVESKINNIISTLNNCYNNVLNKLNSYKNSNYYNKYKNNITVNKIIINQKRDNLNIMFYKLVIKKNTHILNNRLNNILNNIIIPINEYNNMKNKYKGEHFTILFTIL
jgi:hypothetical protein